MADLLDLIAAKNPEEASALLDEGVLQDSLKGLVSGAGRGLTTDLVGAPVDIINTLLGAIGLPVSDKPVGGSKQIRELTNQPKEDSPTESVGNLLSSFINPSTATAKALPVLGGIFIGEKAKIFDKGLAKTFEDLEKIETTPNKSFSLSGTHRGPLDKKLRQEVSDLPAELKADIAKLKDEGVQVKLSDVLKHDELYAAYPELANIGVRGQPLSGGSFLRDKNLIKIGRDAKPEDQLSVLLHEVQHAIQGKEDFVRGGNPYVMVQTPAFRDAAKSLNVNLSNPESPVTQKQVQDLLDELYMRLGGEAEARAVQRRHLLEKAQPGSTINQNPLLSYDRAISDLLWPPK